MMSDHSAICSAYRFSTALTGALLQTKLKHLIKKTISVFLIQMIYFYCQFYWTSLPPQQTDKRLDRTKYHTELNISDMKEKRHSK